mgnify:CR=1 FL=1
MLYQIKRCSGPCVGKIAPDDYQHLVDQAVAFLRGKSDDVKNELSWEMEAAAEVLDFEKAFLAHMRDNHPEIGPALVKDKGVSDSTKKVLDQAIQTVKAQFA